MSKKIKIISVIVIILVIAIIVLIFTVMPEDKLSTKTIKIGFVGPLTGNASDFGQVEKNVTEMAKNEINARGGINGQLLEIIYEDGLCKSKEAVAAAYKLINVDQVKIILSACSSETLAIAPVTEENKVILFTAWANNPDISYAGDYVFRNAVSDAVMAKLAAEYIIKEDQTIGMIYEMSHYAEGMKKAFTKEYTALGGEIQEEGFAQDAADVRTQITKLLAKKPGAVFVNPDSATTGILTLKTLKEMGYGGQIYGNFFAGSSEVLGEEVADGLIYFADPVIDDNNIKLKLYDKYQKQYGVMPVYEYPAVARYDSVNILAQAITEVGYDSDLIRDYLYQLDNYSGALGTYHFDSNGDVVGLSPAVKQIIDGEVVIYQE